MQTAKEVLLCHLFQLQLVEDGFSPNDIEDNLLYRDVSQSTYGKLTKDVYEQIVNTELRLWSLRCCRVLSLHLCDRLLSRVSWSFIFLCDGHFFFHLFSQQTHQRCLWTSRQHWTSTLNSFSAISYISLIGISIVDRHMPGRILVNGYFSIPLYFLLDWHPLIFSRNSIVV